MVKNLFSHIKGRSLAEGVEEESAGESCWIKKGGTKKRLEKIA
jgi:hypothetical protein